MDRLRTGMLMDEADAGGAGGGGTGDGAGQDGGEGQDGAGARHEQSIPYERFQEVTTKYRDLENKYGQMQSMLENMKGALSPEQKRGFKMDYNNPDKSIEDYVSKMLEDKISGLKRGNSEQEQSQKQASAIKWFREQEGYGADLEEKAAQFIKENGLNAKDKSGNLVMDPEKAVQLAYKFVTLGDGSGYTRSVKEGLNKPGQGSKGKNTDPKEELKALNSTDEKYEEKMKKIMEKIAGG